MQINVDSKGHELLPRVNYDFPIHAGRNNITSYEGRRFLHHWHKEPEITVIIKGEMEYQVNDKIYHLSEGQAVFVNSNCIHSAWNYDSECLYQVVNFAHWLLFDPEKSRIFKKYIDPVIMSDSLPCIILDSSKGEEDAKMISMLIEIAKEKEEKKEGYEFKMMSLLCNLLAILMPKALHIIESGETQKKATRNITRIKNAINYVEEHYSEEITLSDLSLVTGLSTSEFCRCFKSIMRYTPMEYVTNIRIRKSLLLLAKHGEFSITEIAEKCGFSGASYYSEMFKKYMMCTPTRYAASIKHAST